MSKLPAIVRLEITSWVGVSVGAVHSYGRLTWQEGPDEREDLNLDHPMSAKQAAWYNKEMAEQGYGYLKKKRGDLSNDFDSKADVIQAAKKKIAELYPDGNAWLILGTSLSAQPILFWPPGLKKLADRSNALADEWEKIGGYEGNASRAAEIDDEWNLIFKQVLSTKQNTKTK